ncbi:MAG: hypothetical protein U9N53_02885 [Bacteroidota bacterium]|nr:hypothetical protein [Bacteroidota bacterium]
MLQYHDLKIEAVHGDSDDIRKHISRVVLGTPGRMRYRHIGVLGKLDQIGKTIFLTLRKGHRLLGTVGLVQRLVETGENRSNAFFIRYFAIFSPMRSKKHDKKQSRGEKDKQFVLKDQLKEQFDRMDQFIEDPDLQQFKTVSYAFIEKENERSLDFSETMGYQTLGEVRTMPFSRFFPKYHKNVQSLPKEERKNMMSKIRGIYRDHSLFFIDYIPLNNHYFVYKKDGEIIAGVQSSLVDFEIIEMPGFSGWLLLKVIPMLPVLKSLIQAKKISFVSFDGIWYKPGCEKYLIPLFESVCAKFNTKVAISWFDSRSRIYKEVKKAVRMGFLTRILGTLPGIIRIKFFNQTETEKREFLDKPVYISGYDMS